jgi:hypothetical protein
MEPPQSTKTPVPEKPEVAWDEEFSLSKGSCCDDGETPAAHECFLK